MYHSLSQKKRKKERKPTHVFDPLYTWTLRRYQKKKYSVERTETDFVQCIISRKNTARKRADIQLPVRRPCLKNSKERNWPTFFFFYKTRSYLADDTQSAWINFNCTRTGIHLRNAFISGVLSSRFPSRRNVPWDSRQSDWPLPPSHPFFFPSAIHWSRVRLARVTRLQQLLLENY